MKRSPLPARTKPLVRSGLKHPRSGVQRRAGAISDGRVTETTRQCRKSRKSTATGKKLSLRFGKIPKNPDFRAFVRTLPCILAGKIGYAPLGTLQVRHICRGRIEASHVGRSAMAMKAADETCLLMRVEAHRTGPFAYHKSNSMFWMVWGGNKKVLVERAQQLAREAGIHVAEGEIL